jgi:2'-5' RNA ligase
MAFAISITTQKAAGAPLWALWREFGGLEETPSMLAFDYPPHVTLAAYESVPEDRLSDTLRSELGAFPPFRLTFTRLAFFENPQLVFWAAPMLQFTGASTLHCATSTTGRSAGHLTARWRPR